MDILGFLQNLFSGREVRNPHADNPNIESPEPPVNQLTSGFANYKRQQMQNMNAPRVEPATGSLGEVTRPSVRGAQTQRGGDRLEQIIAKGLEKYPGEQPIATASGALAQAGRELPDPLLPTILSLIETAGGNRINRGQNNLFNILPTRSGVNYPDYNTAITGGNGQQGLLELLTGSGLYDDYLESGKLSDFFNTYSPATENAPVQQQVERYNSIRDQYFQ